ncbi:MAG: Wzz/FepE/Etk N-terminal domain-containing protein [Pseudomonadota bacterium]
MSSTNPATPDDTSAIGGLYLAQLLDILRRRRRFVVIVTVCGTLLAAMAGLLVPPKYTATAQIIVESPQNADRSTSIASNELAIDTLIKILTSHDHLQQVRDSLLADPDFVALKKPADIKATSPAAPLAAPKPARPSSTSAAHRTDTSWLGELKRRVGIWTSALISRGHDTLIDIDDLEHDLRVIQEGRSRIVSARYTARSPDEAAIVANRVVQIYIDGQSEQQGRYAARELARLQERITEARNDVLQATAAVQAAIQEQGRAAQDKTGDATREASARLRTLERGAAASAQVYSNLQKREKELLSQQDGITSDIRLLSLATPPDRPSSHNPILFVVPALIILLIGSCFIAVIMEQGDQQLRSERDVSDLLGIPCVGLMPQLPRMRAMRPHQYMLTEPFSAYTESIRSVVGELWLTTPQRGPTTVLICSSVPGEGKTTAAVSIGVCAAMLGRRVLLIDLDFKRPSIGRELGTSSEKGIFDILLRNRPPAEAITHIADLGIDYLPMSSCPVDALPILAGERMPNLLRQLRENYDSVIIDGPPLLVITETRFLATMVDKVVFVVKWASTRRDVVRNAINLLRNLDGIGERNVAPPIVLLSQVDLKAHADYRYGDVGEALVTYQNYYSHAVRFSDRRPPASTGTDDSRTLQ